MPGETRASRTAVPTGNFCIVLLLRVMIRPEKCFSVMMMMIAPNSLVTAVTSLRGGGGRGGRSKKRKTDRNSDSRRGRFHRSNSVRGVECKEQEKQWTVVWGSNPQEWQSGQGTSSILLRDGGNYRKKNEVVKGYFFRA